MLGCPSGRLGTTDDLPPWGLPPGHPPPEPGLWESTQPLGEPVSPSGDIVKMEFLSF